MFDFLVCQETFTLHDSQTQHSSDDHFMAFEESSSGVVERGVGNGLNDLFDSLFKRPGSQWVDHFLFIFDGFFFLLAFFAGFLVLLAFFLLFAFFCVLVFFLGLVLLGFFLWLVFFLLLFDDRVFLDGDFVNSSVDDDDVGFKGILVERMHSADIGEEEIEQGAS